MTEVVVAGVSTRAMAESAARAGYVVTAIDGYADRDQDAGVRAIAVPSDSGQPFTAATAAIMGARIPCDAVAYQSNLDNDPEAVRTLALGRTLWGNSPETLRRVRNPFMVADTFRAHGVTVPRVCAADPTATVTWLTKPFSSGGGHHIRRHTDGKVRRGHYLQEFVAGIPASIVFIAAGGRATPLAVTRQLIGDASFGASGFRYCGNILAPRWDLQFDDENRLPRHAGRLAEIAASAFGLTGVNGIDFIAQRDAAIPIEINPRWTASCELVDRAHGPRVFALHADACRHGRLPSAADPPALVHAFGKAIVFAREACLIESTDAWLDDRNIRDVPQNGARFHAGAPVCSVFAAADTSTACYAALQTKAQHIYDQLRPMTDHES